MRRLAGVGITTREACGNTVRNVTACPHCRRLPHGDLRRHALCQGDGLFPARASRHSGLRPEVQNRLFRLRRRGLRPDELARHRVHRQVRGENGTASAASSSTSAADWAPCRTRPSSSTTSCPRKNCCRWQGGHPRVRPAWGEKNRQRARLKFLVKKLGMEEFKRLVLEERQILRRRSALDGIPERSALHRRTAGTPGRKSARRSVSSRGFESGAARTSMPQRQAGYAAATVTLPLGDLTSEQARAPWPTLRGSSVV